MNIWVGTPASFDEDQGLAIEWQECFDESYICCLWLIFFGRAEIFVGIWTINGKIVSVLNLKKRKTPKTDLLFVDADKKMEECIRF